MAASSSFFKNTGTSTQLQGSAAASAAAALASEQAALASENAAQTSETNAAASAAAALVSQNAAATSATSATSEASSAAASAVASQSSADNAQDWAVKTNGIVDSTDYASKAWAVGGTGVTGSGGASKEWATTLGSTVDGSEYSAKHYSQVAASEATDAAADAVATAADRVQTGLDVAASAASVLAASASQVSAAASAAAAENSYDQFDDRYLGSKTGYATAQTGPALDNDGNALVSGSLFFSADANEMRIFDGAGWIAASSAGSASLNNYHYTATASQTTFSGSDENSNTLSYTVNNLIVTRNGIVLEDGTDYTATSGTSIVLAVAAAVGDEINIVAFKSFTTADMVSKTNGGTFQSNVTVNGTMTATAFSGDGSALTNLPAAGISDVVQDTTPQLGGNLDTNGNNVNFGDNNSAIFGAGNDLTINHDGSNSFITDSGTGSLYIQGTSGVFIRSADGGENLAGFTDDGAATLYHDNAAKIATTSFGAQVTGSLAVDTITNASSSTDVTIDTNFDIILDGDKVGIGTASPTKKVSASIGLSDTDGYVLEYSGDAKGGILLNPVGGEVRMGAINSSGTYFPTFYSNNSEAMRIDSSGRVGIGTASPAYKLSILENGNNFIQFSQAGDSVAGSLVGRSSSKHMRIQQSENANIEFYTNNIEKMRLNSSGGFWVGEAVGTVLNGNGGENVTGIMHSNNTANGYTVIQSNGSNAPLYVTRTANASGTSLIHFGNSGSNVGKIGDAGGRIFLADQAQNTGISFYQACLLPTNINGTAVDNTYDCGHPSYRWDDIRATNGTIQTSDQNEKQQIATLTNAEMTAAKSISTLFKTFKWNSAVSAKGDAARTHAGVIAQDVQAAMTAAGLDAGDYAFFISNTWWETQTEVPAVEADEENGIEAVAAYTSTDIYDTAEEAPEGATERTRMGIRYPELLAFVGAATEQRLANIETRLAALEAN